jgi:hypothetical protein
VRRLVTLGHGVAVFHRGRTQADLPPEVVEILGDRHSLAAHVPDFQRHRPEVVVDMIAFTEGDALGLARRTVVMSSAGWE